MRFSLIVATIGRTEELIRLFHSLECQSHRDFEVIVVDQNPDDRLMAIIRDFGPLMTIRRLTSAPGLSRARNVGIQSATGDILCFPDDDCWYGNDLLELVNAQLSANPGWDGLIIDAVDANGKAILPWPDRAGRLTRPMSWRRACSIAQFVRRGVFTKIGTFDESLGAGSGTPWGCGEDQDIMLRVLNAGFWIEFDPAIGVCHPPMVNSFDDTSKKKVSLRIRRRSHTPQASDAVVVGVPVFLGGSADSSYPASNSVERNHRSLDDRERMAIGFLKRVASADEIQYAFGQQDSLLCRHK